MLIILLIIIFFIISISGLIYLIPFILAIINFILSSLNLITNRNNFISRLIELISLSYIIFVIIINTIELGDSLYNLSFSYIIYFRDFKYNRNCYVYNQRTQFLNLNDTKDFLSKLNDNQIYLIDLKYQFLLKTNEYFSSTMSHPILITNQLD